MILLWADRDDNSASLVRVALIRKGAAWLGLDSRGFWGNAVQRPKLGDRRWLEDIRGVLVRPNVTDRARFASLLSATSVSSRICGSGWTSAMRGFSTDRCFLARMNPSHTNFPL